MADRLCVLLAGVERIRRICVCGAGRIDRCDLRVRGCAAIDLAVAAGIDARAHGSLDRRIALDGHADRKVDLAVGVRVEQGTRVPGVATRQAGDIPLPGYPQVAWGWYSNGLGVQVLLSGLIFGSVLVVHEAEGRWIGQ